MFVMLHGLVVVDSVTDLDGGQLCNEEPDNMPEAAVDIWSLNLTYPIVNLVDIPSPLRWATLKRDLPKDDRGQIHVNYEVLCNAQCEVV